MGKGAPTQIKPAQHRPSTKQGINPAQIQKPQLLQLHQLRELEEQVHVIVEPESEDVVQAERVPEAQAPQHGQDGLGDDILIVEVDAVQVDAADPQAAEAQLRQIEIGPLHGARDIGAVDKGRPCLAGGDVDAGRRQAGRE